MNFFTAVKQASFASKLFAAVGLNFETLFAAGNENALKAHIEGAVAAAPAKPDAEQTRLITEAVAENEKLTSKISTLEAAITKHGAVVAQRDALISALAVAGISAESISDEKGISAEKFKVAHEAAVAKSARTFLAKSGHPGLTETVAAEPTSGGKRSMTRAAFTALNASEQAKFSKEVREGKAVLTD